MRPGCWHRCSDLPAKQEKMFRRRQYRLSEPWVPQPRPLPRQALPFFCRPRALSATPVWRKVEEWQIGCLPSRADRLQGFLLSSSAGFG